MRSREEGMMTDADRSHITQNLEEAIESAIAMAEEYCRKKKKKGYKSFLALQLAATELADSLIGIRNLRGLLERQIQGNEPQDNTKYLH